MFYLDAAEDAAVTEFQILMLGLFLFMSDLKWFGTPGDLYKCGGHCVEVMIFMCGL